MTTTANRKTVRLVPRDYQKIGMEIVRKPMTRYVLVGIGLVVLTPIVMRLYRNENVSSFVRDNLNTIKNRIDYFINSSKDKLESLNH